MRLALRLLVVLVALAMVLVAAVWFGGRSYFRKSVAQYEGTVAVPGPGAPIEVLFDARFPLPANPQPPDCNPARSARHPASDAGLRPLTSTSL